MQSSSSRTKSKTKKDVSAKRKKQRKKIRGHVKTDKKHRDDKAKLRKSSKNDDRKKRKKKIASIIKKAIKHRKFLSLVPLPLATGDTYPTFALVIEKHQKGETFRAIAQPDQIVGKTARMTAEAGQAIADADREADFDWSLYEEPISEQVEEMFSFRVEPGDVYVKPEVWAKIIRRLPENFVIPDPALTTFFDNMNAIHAMKVQGPTQESVTVTKVDDND
ncbi:hypothetical protein SD70_05640 [Gordoniibacillus kamchatkensis]|uniref:Uncharacterized protein n=1 Tax=Gordoniibacillus kamchatkensis TaxID=1590651 RepID=A0ABR5AKS3_9BACL|nr:hypothetical protein [Paenibacillus sp. VKM B-2647]KIL41614.1 hypothetical protein SD70_05640 [Paenibacillus sp. VKM B-2647]